MILQPLTISTDAPHIVSDDTVRRIRQLYNGGADMHFIITYIVDNDRIMLKKSIIEDIGLRNICREVSEPDGSPCLPPGIYDLIAEQQIAQEIIKSEHTDSIHAPIIKHLGSFPCSSVKEIAESIQAPEQQIRKYLSELQDKGEVIKDKKDVSTKVGRPKEVWSLNFLLPNKLSEHQRTITSLFSQEDRMYIWAELIHRTRINHDQLRTALEGLEQMKFLKKHKVLARREAIWCRESDLVNTIGWTLFSNKEAERMKEHPMYSNSDE